MPNAEKRSEIFSRLTKVFRDVFDDDSLELTETMSAEDIPDWDSLTHISLCVAVEREFNIKLNAAEIASFSNVGKLADMLSAK